MGHRQSLDFDFFTSRTFSPAGLQAAIPFLEGGTLAQGEPNTLAVWVRPLPKEREVKVSFFGGIGFPVIDRPDRPDPEGIVSASLRDLAGPKAKVINQRVELKDYLDVAALLDAGMTLPQIVAAAVAIFPGQVDSISTMSAITHFGGVKRSCSRSRSRRSCERLRGVPRPFPRPRRHSLRSRPLPRPSTGSLRRHW